MTIPVKVCTFKAPLLYTITQNVYLINLVVESNPHLLQKKLRDYCKSKSKRLIPLIY